MTWMLWKPDVTPALISSSVYFLYSETFQ